MDEGVHEVGESGLEVGGEAGVWARGAEGCAARCGESSEALLHRQLGDWSAFFIAGGHGLEACKLRYHGLGVDVACYGFETVAIHGYLYFEPARALAHHGQPDVDKLSPLGRGENTDYRILI